MFLSLFNLLNFVFTILSEDTGFALAICAIAFTCFWIFPCYRRSPTPKQESQSGKALNVYAGSYTGFTKPRTLGWVGTPNPGAGITHFRLNASTAKLEPSGHVVAQDSPTWLEVSPRGDFLVATHELSHHTGVPPQFCCLSFPLHLIASRCHTCMFQSLLFCLGVFVAP